MSRDLGTSLWVMTHRDRNTFSPGAEVGDSLHAPLDCGTGRMLRCHHSVSVESFLRWWREPLCHAPLHDSHLLTSCQRRTESYWRSVRASSFDVGWSWFPYALLDLNLHPTKTTISKKHHSIRLYTNFRKGQNIIIFFTKPLPVI